MHLDEGVRIPPDHTLVHYLGKGSFGQVWKAVTDTGFSHAMKFIQLNDEAAEVEREALDIIKAVNHPHLLYTITASQHGGYLIVTMELAERTLEQEWKAARDRGFAGIPPNDLLRYMGHVADALDYLNAPSHSILEKTNVGIQHCDIKPANLLLVRPVAKVADFSTAMLRRRTVTSMRGGLTFEYAAPEFFDGEVSRWSDQYSLAVTYCELRGGRLPFTGNFGQIMAGHKNGVPDLSMLGDDAERRVVGRALDKNPRKRWPDCNSFILALRSLDPQPLIVRSRDLEPVPFEPFAPGDPPAEDEQPACGLYRVYPHTDYSVIGACEAGALIHDYRTHDVKTLELPSGSRGEGVQVCHQIYKPVCAACSGDDRFCIVGCSDHSLKWVDVANKRVLFELQGHTAAIEQVAVTPDGKFALSGSRDHTARLWDLRRRKEVRSWELLSFVSRVALTRDASICLACDNRLWMYKKADGPQVEPVEIEYDASSFGCHPDGRHVIIGLQDGTIRVIEIGSRAEVLGLGGHEGPVTAVRYSVDGSRILSAGYDGTIRLWEPADHLEVFRGEGLEGWVDTIGFLRDPAFVMAAPRINSIRVWRVPQS